MKNSIRLLRMRHGLSLAALARAIGRDRSQLSRAESGASFFSEATLLAIAGQLNCTIRDLLTDPDYWSLPTTELNSLFHSVTDADRRKVMSLLRVMKEKMAKRKPMRAVAIKPLPRGRIVAMRDRISDNAKRHGAKPAPLHIATVDQRHR